MDSAKHYVEANSIVGRPLDVDVSADAAPTQDMASLLLECLWRDNGERVAVQMASGGQTADDRITTAQWVRESLRLRRALAPYIGKRDDVTMIVTGNSCFFGVAAHAAISLGRFCALHVVREPTAWSGQVRVVRPRVILAERHLADDVADAVRRAGLETVPLLVVAPSQCVGGQFEATESVEGGFVGYDEFVGEKVEFDVLEELDKIKRRVDPLSEIAILALTTGTTSAPKAYCLTHADVWLWTLTHLGPWRLAPDDGTNTNRCLVASQQGNALAESLSCFAAPLHKCTVYLQRMPNSIATISDAAECIERFRIPFISITTWTLQVLAWLVESGEKQFDLSAAKAVQVSGMSTPGYQMRRFAKLLPSAVIHKVYGSTEFGKISGDIRMNGEEFRLAHPYSNGPLFGSKRRLMVAAIDGRRLPDGRRCLLPPGERGELLVNAQIAVAGGKRYLGNDEATLRFRCEYDGFYNTGDYGFYTADGGVYVEDRCNDMIRLLSKQSKTVYVSPGLIEAIITAFDARIFDAGVVAKQDSVDAVVDANGEEVDVEALRRFVRDELASLPPFEVEEGVADALRIGRVHFLRRSEAPIERNFMGKIVRRHLLRDQAKSN